jgi:UDP-glucose:(heptosyl)LPS alpha-1,3-glucosyltransferase
VNSAVASQNEPFTVACAVFKYFPFGGMQRDFVRIAEALHRRGARVRVYVGQLEGQLPDFIDVVQVPLRGISNHQQLRSFSEFFNQQLQRQPATIKLGFNKLPNLDWYYAADGCLLERWQHSAQNWLRWLPRYRTYAQFERAVFNVDSHCNVLLISDIQGEHYQRHYHTQPERLISLPPGISKERFQTDASVGLRERKRQELGIASDASILLSVGSGFRIKGVDRSLAALAQLPAELRARMHFLVVGQDNATAFVRQAENLGLSRVHFLGGRHDVPELMAAADLLLHPAYSENTGTVLLEAVTAGLPVICSGRCGYAPRVAAAGGGIVLAEPFSLTQYAEAIARLLRSHDDRRRLSELGRSYAKNADWFAMPERVAELILRHKTVR